MARDTKIVYYGVCLDSNDPLMAGRIRAVLDDDFKVLNHQKTTMRVN